MIRAIVGIAVAIALLTTLHLWFPRARVTPSIEPPPVEDLEAPASVVEPIPAPATESGDVPEPAALRTEPNIMALITKRPLPDIESPPWSDEMERMILSYIAQQPNLALTDLQVQCAKEGCVIFMGGDKAPVYDMNFDVFASEHGFSAAFIRGDGNEARIVTLQR